LRPIKTGLLTASGNLRMTFAQPRGQTGLVDIDQIGRTI
jgi:hypothetical protein